MTMCNSKCYLVKKWSSVAIKLEVDKHILGTMLYRFWTVVAGLVTLILVAISLSLIEQGYYFTFASLLMIQIFFELGLSQIVVQITAHEVANLKKNLAGCYEGDNENIARVANLQLLIRRWYAYSGWLFFIFACPIGLVLMDSEKLSFNEWGPPWIVLVGFTAINLNLSWKLAMVEGFALVSDVAQLRLIQSILGFTLQWALLVAGVGLWFVVIVPLVMLISTSIWLKSDGIREIFSITPLGQAKKLLTWKGDIFPYQWKIAVSWISGFFMIQLFVPLVFHDYGPVEAGRIGLTISIFNAINIIGISWVSAKNSAMAMMIARGESNKLLLLFKKLISYSTYATAFMSTIATIVIWGAQVLNIPYAQRVADLPVVVVFAIMAIVNCLIFSSAIFMRAHKNEPMLVPSVVGGLLVFVGALIFVKDGILQMLMPYLLINSLVILPWTVYILNRYLRIHVGASKTIQFN
jgi:hypothetical protein